MRGGEHGAYVLSLSAGLGGLIAATDAGPASVLALTGIALSVPARRDLAVCIRERRVEGAARLRRVGTGEVYDVEWTPSRPMDATLETRIEGTTLRQSLRVRW